VETGNKLTKTESILYINNQFHFWDKSEKKEVTLTKDKPFELNPNCIVFVDTPDFNLIPLAIAENISNSEKITFLTTNVENKLIVKNNINQLESELCWLINESDNALIHAKTPGSKIKHIAEAIINGNFQDENSMVLFNTKSAVYISAYCDKKFKIINRFEIINNEDLLYYTLLTIKETGLSNKRFTIYQHGLKNEYLTSKLMSTLPKCTIKQMEENSYTSILD
jgi:hypothetical protein